MEQNIILKLLTQKDNKAYHYLFRHYFIVLKTVANYYIKSDQVAEDLVQEVFISLYNDNHEFASLNEVKNYLFIALRNKCFNYIRKQKVRDRYYKDSLSSHDEIEDFWEKVLKEDVYSLLFQAIQKLPPQCRQVMLLSLEGMKLSEIAEKLQLSLDTVKEYKGSGKKKLQDLLRNHKEALLIILLGL